jgi:hypothetical protein
MPSILHRAKGITMNFNTISITVLATVTLAAAPCTSEHEAKSAAEFETLGEAVFLRLVPSNAGFGKWEVLVHMPKEAFGWRVFIDRDNGKILDKTKIKNPPTKSKHHHKN